MLLKERNPCKLTGRTHSNCCDQGSECRHLLGYLVFVRADPFYLKSGTSRDMAIYLTLV